ncbi:hypothetical protein [Halobaculum magnesiiphilum]|uniref:Uncharacterized protein n=1 Tax=Halobaculum magnesiiphilum TaxID=1017351 RepID=A0A8T8WCD4_9EURY|nr:hypothetical protein [Halobaculum magnesiiphilum]QZP37499.1 hypothetical protein K6T50_14675 [Halobaculum magnesiiphilum]
MDASIGPGAESIRPHVFVYPLAVWVAMATIAVANGVLRETVLVPRVGEYTGHVASTAALVAAILLFSFAYFSWTPIDYTRAELLLIGIVWTAFTVGFEFVVGHVEGTPVSVTLGQYDVLAGQVWIAVPIALLVSPPLFGWYLSP